MTEKTRTDEDFDLAVASVVSFYQSKRANLKHQVTGWHGKFMICKGENNSIRRMNREYTLVMDEIRKEVVEKDGRIAQLETKNDGLIEEVQDKAKLLTSAREDTSTAAGVFEKDIRGWQDKVVALTTELAGLRSQDSARLQTVERLKKKIAHLESGALA